MSTVKLNIHIKAVALAEIIAQPDLFIQQLSKLQIKHLQDVVFDQLHDKDGAPQIEDFSIPIFEINQNYSHGRFRIKFKINRQFCCSDTRASLADYIDFNFSYSGSVLMASGDFVNWNVEN